MASKKFYTSKTFWFNVLAVVVALAAAFGYTGELPTGAEVFLPAVIALINIILRFVTSQAVRL